jgi:hypothetical protein
LGVLVALALWGFLRSIEGRPLFNLERLTD